jgi:cbb3-type cytochrome c oxidase subunit I
MKSINASINRPKWLTKFGGNDSASLAFFVGAVLLIILGVTEGLIMVIQFVFPDFGAGVPWLVLGRVRQSHTNTVMFGFLSMGQMAFWYYVIPRLTGRKMWSESLGVLAAILWGIAVLVGVVLELFGLSQGREYAEMIYWVDVAVEVVCVLNLVNMFMTISKRVEQNLYVVVWYIVGALMWFPMLYFIGNVMWDYPMGSLTGINDSIFNWFYGHNVLGLWFTPGILAISYFIVPRETKTPLYSHALSLIAFFGLVLFYTGVGGHHLEWAPIPYWVKTIAVAESIGMSITIVAFLMNMWLTMRGNWNKVASSIPLKFATVSWISYVLVSFQGTQEALRSINLLTHFTQYVTSHAHLSLLLFGASGVMAAAYYCIPRMLNISIFSRKLANTGFILYVIGFSFFFLGFMLVGLTQGTSWVHIGLPVWTVLAGIRPFLALRAAGGMVLWLGFILFVINILATVIVRRPAVLPAPSRIQSKIGLVPPKSSADKRRLA